MNYVIVEVAGADSLGNQQLLLQYYEKNSWSVYMYEDRCMKNWR